MSLRAIFLIIPNPKERHPGPKAHPPLPDPCRGAQFHSRLGTHRHLSAGAIQVDPKTGRDLGGVLLHRDGKNTRLTELGRTMRAEFEAIIVNFDRATLLAESITKGQSSALNVGLSNTLGRLPVTDFLHRVATELGGTRLLVHEALTKELAALVLSGALDCCICSDCDNLQHQTESRSALRGTVAACVRKNTSTGGTGGGAGRATTCAGLSGSFEL